MRKIERKERNRRSETSRTRRYGPATVRYSLEPLPWSPYQEYVRYNFNVATRFMFVVKFPVHVNLEGKQFSVIRFVFS